MNADHKNYIGKLVVARTAQGDLVAVGRCVSFVDAPTVGINTNDGHQIHWRADMVRVIDNLSTEEVDAIFAVR